MPPAFIKSMPNGVGTSVLVGGILVTVTIEVAITTWVAVSVGVDGRPVNSGVTVIVAGTEVSEARVTWMVGATSEIERQAASVRIPRAISTLRESCSTFFIAKGGGAIS